MRSYVILAGSAAFVLWAAPAQAKRTPDPSELPNIVLIVADDLGWNDVPWHNPYQENTPGLDRLGTEGTCLERFYVAPVCTPTRMALLTGRYPIRWGMQDWVINDAVSDYGIPRTEELLPEYLAENGYGARLAAGKWHLGGRYSKYHPINNGFTHYVGNYLGVVDYATLQSLGEVDWHVGFDNLGAAPDPPCDGNECHSQALGTEAKAFIEAHYNEPFFLYVPFQAVHSSLPTDERPLMMQRLLDMDASIEMILDALDDKNIADKTIVWFLSDNGGAKSHSGPLTNSPLRGEKSTPYEGGIRSASVIRYPNGGMTGGFEPDLISHVDVMPTLRGLIEAAAGPLDNFINQGELDGQDMSAYIDGAATPSSNWNLADSIDCPAPPDPDPAPYKEHFTYIWKRKNMGEDIDGYRYSLIRYYPGLQDVEPKLYKIVWVSDCFDNQCEPLPCNPLNCGALPDLAEVELYDISLDPNEQTPLSNNMLKASLLESLCCWLSLEDGVNLPPPLPLPDEGDPFTDWHFRDINTQCFDMMIAYKESPTDDHEKFAVLHGPGNIEQFNDTRNLPDGQTGLFLQGIGRSRLDGLLYGITADGQDLYQIDGTELTVLDELDGLVLHLGAVRGMPAGVDITAGDVAPDGKSYLCFDDVNNRLYSIELSNLVTTLDMQLSGNLKIADFTFDSAGNLLAYDEVSDKVFVRDLTGQISSHGPFAALGSTGAVWLGAGADEVYNDLVVLKRVTTSPLFPAGLYRLDLQAQPPTTDLVFVLPSGWTVIDGAGCFDGCIVPEDQCAIGDCCELPLAD